MSSSTPGQELEPAAESQAAQPDLTFWQVVRLSLKGQHLDYTAVPLNRAVLLLAVPMVLEMIMESLFAVVDVFWVSRLGSDAIAVVGLTESVMTLIYAVAIGISFAATAIVARRIGEQDPERAAQAAGQIIVLGVTISAAMGLLMSYFASDILRLMGAGENIVALGTDFARVMLGCNVTVFMIFLINAIFRGAGDAVLAMRTLWLANALNIVLGPFFIFGWGPFPEMGVTGAAVATNIGRGVGVLYQLWHLAGFHSRVRVRARHLKPLLVDVRAIMTTASTGIAQLLIGTTSWVGLFKILADIRQHRAGGLHHRHARRDVRADAGLGPGERGRDSGGSEPGRGQTGPRRAGDPDRGAFQCHLSGSRRPGLRAARRADCATVHG